MIEIVPYQSAHLDMMRDFGNQEAIMRPFIGQLRDLKYEDQGPAYSVFADDEVICCAGLVEMTPYRAYTWAFMPEQAVKQRFVAIHRAVARFLAEQTYRRIDAHVAVDDMQGHRWARLLGFHREVFCRAWALPDGSAVSEYVRWG